MLAISVVSEEKKCSAVQLQRRTANAAAQLLQKATCKSY